MALGSLQLRHFRNYRHLDLDLSSGITIFTGNNGIGKTSILESVCLLGSGRSFRAAKNSDFIHKTEEFSVIKGVVDQKGLITEIEIRIYPTGKKVFLDQKHAKTTTSLLELLPTIVFSPADHWIVEGDSSYRKQFLNRAVAHVDWEYVDDLHHYNKALLQRNKLLKQCSHLDWTSTHLQDLLLPWDEQLLTYGSRLITRRKFYLQELGPLALREYCQVSNSTDAFELHYQPLGEEEKFSFDTEGDAREFFEKKRKDSMRRDFFSGSTQVGPHKDEILLTLNGNKVKFYGSQGEKKTCALALRLGELALFYQKTQRAPVLLFDDVSSELDSTRRRSLVDLLRKENTQVLITATDLPSSLLNDVGKNFRQLDLHTVGERK